MRFAGYITLHIPTVEQGQSYKGMEKVFNSFFTRCRILDFCLFWVFPMFTIEFIMSHYIVVVNTS